MVLKAFFLLATLALVSLPMCSATDQQQQQAEQQCVSKAELDSVVTQMTAQTAAVESELNTWQNATLHILKKFLLDNPTLLLETVQDKLENIQYKMEQQQDKTNRLLDELQNTTMDGHANLQDKVDMLQDNVGTLQDNIDMLQDKVINLEDKLDTFQNTTEASTRKHHHEVVELLQNASCSSDGVYSDCKDALNQGQTTSGVYIIKPDHQPEFQAYCDMDTDGGGWTVFQRRQDGSVDFYRYWANYQQGFGHPSGEFWLGLEKIHHLTSTATQLRVDMKDFEGNSAYAQYSNFSVGNSVSKYTLSVSGYNGTAGDSLTIGQVHNGKQFSTRDQDNDARPNDGHCAQLYKGGWWYDSCHRSNLNGLYRGGYHPDHYADGVHWFSWKGHNYSLKFTEMKLRSMSADITS